MYNDSYNLLSTIRLYSNYFYNVFNYWIKGMFLMVFNDCALKGLPGAGFRGLLLLLKDSK